MTFIYKTFQTISEDRERSGRSDSSRGRDGGGGSRFRDFEDNQDRAGQTAKPINLMSSRKTGILLMKKSFGETRKIR